MPSGCDRIVCIGTPTIELSPFRGRPAKWFKSLGSAPAQLVMFLPDRPPGPLCAKVTLASRLGLIDAAMERGLNALRMLSNVFAHSAESNFLVDPAQSDRLSEIYSEARSNRL